MLRIAEAQVSPTLRQIVITSISNMQKTSLGNIRRTKRLIQWGAFIGLLAVIISFVGCAEKEAKALEIVRDGQPQAEIVVAPMRFQASGSLPKICKSTWRRSRVPRYQLSHRLAEKRSSRSTWAIPRS